MNESQRESSILQGQILSGLEVMQRVQDHVDGFLENELEQMGRTTVSAVIISDRWDRLEYLLHKYDAVRVSVRDEIVTFQKLLNSL